MTQFQNDKIPPLIGEDVLNRLKRPAPEVLKSDAKQSKFEEFKKAPLKQLARNKIVDMAAENKE